MRTFWDRVRHSICYELVLICLLVPVISWWVDKPMAQTGAVNVTISILATICNYLYNLGFDHALKALGRSLSERSLIVRSVHAVLFEVVILIVAVPIVMYALELSLIEAVLLDLSVAVLLPVYTYVYNYVYDAMFPVPAAAVPA